MAGKPPRNIPYGHIVMGAVGWVLYLSRPFIPIPLPKMPLAILAGLLTVLAIPRFIVGPREKAERRITKKLRSANRPASKRLAAHMLDKEEFRMELHEHPIALIIWWIWVVLWSTPALLMALYYRDWNILGIHIHWELRWLLLVWTLGVLPVVGRLWLWRHDRICVTNMRIFAVEGIVRLRVSMIPLNKVTDKQMTEPWHGRLLEWLRLIGTTYGLIRLETAGEDTKLSSHIYLPNVLEVTKILLVDALPGKETDGD